MNRRCPFIVSDPSEGNATYVISNYSINIPQILNSTSAYVGFTGSTGTDRESQDTLTWSMSTTLPDIVSSTNNLNDLTSLFNAKFDGGTLIVDGATSSSAYAITANGGSIDINGRNATFSGNITDDTGSPGGRLTVKDSGSGGKVTLSGTNTFTGGLRIESGAEVSAGSSAAQGSGALQMVAAPSGSATLDITGDTTIANAIGMTGNAVFNVASGKTATLTGAITDLGGTAGALVVDSDGSSTGVILLTPATPGSNTYSGGTYANGGTLRAGAANVLPSSGGPADLGACRRRPCDARHRHPDDGRCRDAQRHEHLHRGDPDQRRHPRAESQARPVRRSRASLATEP